MESTPNTSPETSLSPGGCLLRLIWMGFGNAALLFAALHLVHGQNRLEAHAIFGGVTAVLLAARAVDILHFAGTTTDGRPATRADLGAYAGKLLLVAAALWAGASAIHGSVP